MCIRDSHLILKIFRNNTSGTGIDKEPSFNFIDHNRCNNFMFDVINVDRIGYMDNVMGKVGQTYLSLTAKYKGKKC